MANYLSRAEAEVAAGRLWRAREILQGAVRNDPTDVELLASYGLLLDRLGDRVQAGKYLFLSGRRGDQYDDAISVFLTRHAKGNLGNVLAQFPGRLKSEGLKSLPQVVRDDLEALGLPGATRTRDQVGLDVSQGARWWDRIASFVAPGCFFVVLLAVPVGLLTMAYLLYRLVF